jgi:hypothetical protein
MYQLLVFFGFVQLLVSLRAVENGGCIRDEFFKFGVYTAGDIEMPWY